MMDTFDYNYYVEMRELIFAEYKKNIFIDGNMLYAIYDD